MNNPKLSLKMWVVHTEYSDHLFELTGYDTMYSFWALRTVLKTGEIVEIDSPAENIRPFWLQPGDIVYFRNQKYSWTIQNVFVKYENDYRIKIKQDRGSYGTVSLNKNLQDAQFKL